MILPAMAPGSPLLATIADPRRRQIEARDFAVVVGRPDDEMVGCGVLLTRLKGATLVLVTDGALDHAADDRRHGFADVSSCAVRYFDAYAKLAGAGAPDARSAA